jgi:hypothetical protein
MTSLCPSCGRRRAKRACPALGRDICPVCCGTKRLTEIDCPPTCAYLSSARSHPAAVVVRRRESDVRFFVPLVQDLSEPQYRLLLLFQGVVVSQAHNALPPLHDEDVAEGAAAVAATLETARKGIIYEHRAQSGPAQQLATEFTRAITELSRQPGAPSAFERDAAVVLRRIEQGARTAAAALPDEQPPVYLGLLSRLMSHGPDDQARESSAVEPPSRLIIPGQ